MAEFSDFQWLDQGSGHTAYRHALLIDLYLHTKFHWTRRSFLWTDGRTYVRTYGLTFETHFIRSTRRSRPNAHTSYASFLLLTLRWGCIDKSTHYTPSCWEWCACLLSVVEGGSQGTARCAAACVKQYPFHVL